MADDTQETAAQSVARLRKELTAAERRARTPVSFDNRLIDLETHDFAAMDRGIKRLSYVLSEISKHDSKLKEVIEKAQKDFDASEKGGKHGR